MKKKKFFGPEVSNIWSTSAYRNDMSNWTETELVKGDVRNGWGEWTTLVSQLEEDGNIS